MGNKMKIVTVVGTRPEIIRLSEILKQLDYNFNHILVHTNQNYDFELKKIFYKQFNIKHPKYDLRIKEKTTVKTISRILFKIEEVLIKEKPDAFFVLGDTNSALSSIVAKKYKIPIFHYEAGNRCFDQRVPEEINRKIVDHISDINLTYSNFARENLLKEGLDRSRVIKIGSPLKEVITANYEKILLCKILEKLKLKKNKYFVFSFHREENVDDILKLKKFVKLLNKLSNTNKEKIVLTLHPRTKKNLLINNFKLNKKILVIKPLGFFEYIKLQINSKITLSDSGSLPEEASILGLKAICLRDTHERQESSTLPSVVMSELNFKQINLAIKILSKSKKKIKILDDYNQNDISSKIPKIIISYTSIINKKVWKKIV
jgi:UDP-N-acetylglucosamine 2-epimerase